MTIKLLCVGKIRGCYLHEALNEYLKRLRRYIPVEYVEVKAKKRGKKYPESEVKQQEGERLRKMLT